MRFLVIGDPEGRVRRWSIVKLAAKYLQRGDRIVITGDYFSNPLSYYYPFCKAKKSERKEFYFPEIKLLGGLERKYELILMYGNKDLRSKCFGLDRLRSRLRIASVEDFFGEKGPFCFLNGSNVCAVDFCEKAREAKGDVDKELREYRKKSKLAGRARLKDLPKERIKHLEEKYGWVFRVMFDYPYTTNFRFLKRKYSKAEVLLTHTPPLLRKAELIAGSFPDLACYKRTGEGVEAALPNERGAVWEHCGLKIISDFIKRSKFRLVICCHIHEGSGIAIFKHSIVINPGSKIAYLNKERVLPFCLLEADDELRNFNYLLKNWEGEFRGEVSI